jgi:signal transduction histidine kinase
MSYRTFKQVLGETSLERKCRFLFGASLLLLILSSFLWCGMETESIIYDKPRSNSRYVVASVLKGIHAIRLESDPAARKQIEEMIDDLEGLKYEAAIVSLEPVPSRPYIKPVSSEGELETMQKLKVKFLEQLAENRKVDSTAEPITNGDTDVAELDELQDASQVFETYKDATQVPVCEERELKRAQEYHYYQPVYWQESCLSCHKLLDAEHLGELALAADAPTEELLARMPFRAVRVEVGNRPTRRVINRMMSFLTAMAIVTVFLSMVALYIVVRYVIVKPLQHLQDISERVAHGDYQARAEIETRDEFEELATSFNRMLRHMVDTQGELQTANISLDDKVDELAQANMQLYELNRVKSEFLANVSHELRTPLNSIIGFSDVLSGIESLTDRQKKYAQNIGNSGKVLLEIFNDILDLAKMESGNTNVRPSEFSIEMIAQTQIDLVQGLARDKNIDISFDCPKGLPELFQDQAKIQQILTNLLSNAIKFTPDGGRITVKVEPRLVDSAGYPEQVALTVEDTGIGIAEEDRDVIFEKFRQARPVRGSDNLTREFSGTGLGLSIIKEICKLLGGEISFKSQLGHGSAFTAVLPWSLPNLEGVDAIPTVVAPAKGNAHGSLGAAVNGQVAKIEALNKDMQVE